MTRHRFFPVAVAVLSAGWLVPLWMGVDIYLTFWQIEGWPLLRGEHPGNSFSFIQFAASCFKVSFVWLGMVICFWSYVGYAAFTRSRVV
ncbi:hypothetical protein EER27_09350 [Lysobacter psychrotolerans]|uniref:Uncharacterized protein n=1 Tax=Montanilutibacter psychrotolerans TaxID=1327343 RepID=A0A3M8SQP0_9GAMM|nr:hypothetical protein EER27_09350 [Lysobacter psychrotolerans]